MSNISRFIACMIFLIIGIYIGASFRQNDIEKRALQMKDTDCYVWQEIEYIIFGQIQE